MVEFLKIALSDPVSWQYGALGIATLFLYSALVGALLSDSDDLSDGEGIFWGGFISLFIWPAMWMLAALAALVMICIVLPAKIGGLIRGLTAPNTDGEVD